MRLLTEGLGGAVHERRLPVVDASLLPNLEGNICSMPFLCPGFSLHTLGTFHRDSFQASPEAEGQDPSSRGWSGLCHMLTHTHTAASLWFIGVPYCVFRKLHDLRPLQAFQSSAQGDSGLMAETACLEIAGAEQARDPLS